MMKKDADAQNSGTVNRDWHRHRAQHRCKRFVALVRKYTEINELTYENVHELIDRILIHELDKETNTRKIEILYSFVGRVESGDEPTESISYFRQIGADVKSFAI